MGLYRKKPIVIEAFQMTRDQRAPNVDWLDWMHEAWGKERGTPGSLYPTEIGTTDGTLSIATLEGEHRVSWDDWIIRGVAGELYPCKPDIFEATYESVDGGAGVVFYWHDRGSDDWLSKKCVIPKALHDQLTQDLHELGRLRKQGEQHGKCVSCRFMHRREPLCGEWECRRRAPTVPAERYGPRWPKVDEGNSCGEWEPAAEVQP